LRYIKILTSKVSGKTKQKNLNLEKILFQKAGWASCVKENTGSPIIKAVQNVFHLINFDIVSTGLHAFSS
jgi:hypothetical protein